MRDSILLKVTLASPLKLTNDVLEEIKRLAGLTTALTILVHTPPSRAVTRNAGTGSGNSLDGLEWDQFQAIVVGMYTAATKVFLEDNRPLSVVDVLFDSIREGKKLAGAWEETVQYSQRPAEAPVTTLQPGEGARSEENVSRGQKLFTVTALGGTFDHLHAGHKILLTMSAWVTTERLIVGISGTFFSQPFSEIRHIGRQSRLSRSELP